MEPPVPCELVRGYLDFLPHAWNVVHTKRGDSWVRMIVDACRPHDIREETDPEYFCRSFFIYIYIYFPSLLVILCIQRCIWSCVLVYVGNVLIWSMEFDLNM